MPKRPSHPQDINALFEAYLSICNQAMEAHSDEFPYHQMMTAMQSVLGKHSFDLAIYDDEPKGTYSLQLKDNKLKKCGTPTDAKKAWRMNLSYLKRVAAHPDEYIRHPEKLDLDWLKSRIGL